MPVSTFAERRGDMDLDEKIALTKELIRKREEIDQQLNELLSGEGKRNK